MIQDSSHDKIVSICDILGVLAIEEVSLIIILFSLQSVVGMNHTTDANLSSTTRFSSDRYIGKVQFLRHEHGYIRTKTKIQGLRDITFYYSDLPERLKEDLTQGTIVSFSLKKDENGKFSAEHIEIESIQPSMFPSTEVSAMSSPQLVVFSPKQRPDRSPKSVGFIDQISSDDEKSQPCSRKMSDTISSSSVVPCYQSTQDKSEVAHHDLAHLVDLYLDLVISRSFNRYRSSCWLF